MKARTKISACVGALVAMVFICSSLLIWVSDRASTNLAKSNAAHEELTVYLRLSANVFRTFKQARRDLLDGNDGLTFNLNDQEQVILGLTASAEAMEQEEGARGLSPDANAADIKRVTMLKEELQQALAALRTAATRFSEGETEAARQLLRHTLEERVDSTIKTLLDTSLGNERHELDEVVAEAHAVNRISLIVAFGVSILGMAIAGIVIYTLVLRLTRSLDVLTLGAGIFGRGNLAHEIAIDGGDEFGRLAANLNAMARQLLSQNRQLEEARAELELRVAERTAELSALNGELKRRDDRRRMFFAEIGHELRTPLTVLRGEADVALRTRQEHEATYRQALTRIVTVSEQLTRLVNDIFLIAREQAGVLDLRHEAVDLGAIARESVRHMARIMAQCDVHARCAFTDQPVMVDGDAGRLAQLFQILLNNVCDHGGQGATVEISITGQGERWQVSIEDDGPGIAAAEAEQVFEHFHRGSGAASRQGMRGAGLGLPIARAIVNAHGGRIWIDARATGGMSVHFILPRRDMACVASSGACRATED